MAGILPPEVLAQHIAVLGKTGSGKTSTSKLIIEQAVATGARVCVLDPIKSDWWGLTSSADGKHPGLPFHILGGPHGHVPLHAAAGKAVAEIVASGALPLSIIDMADFAAGGLQRFFIDFAEVLFKRIHGVLHLVIEEAHEFCPKERSGIGDENLAIHWAKKLATGSRTKGIRLIVSTQRTQALHNAVLGSCDTLIAHRFTAPADQGPVVKWLKANLKPALAKEVEASLSSLKTGEGWVCSGEAGLFERRMFPRINSYDNTATPDHNTVDRKVATAPVDQDKLRALIGEAVKDAAANDPVALKARIRELEAEVATASTVMPDLEREAMIEGVRNEGFLAGEQAGKLAAWHRAADDLHKLEDNVVGLIQGAHKRWSDETTGLSSPDGGYLAQGATAARVVEAFRTHKPAPKVDPRIFEHNDLRGSLPERPVIDAPPRRTEGVSGVQQKILDALAELEAIGAKEPPRVLVAHMSGYGNVKSTGFTKALSGLSTAGLIGYGNGTVHLTDAGRAAANTAGKPLTNRDLHDRIKAHLSGPGRTMIDTLIAAYPHAVDRETLARSANYENVKSTGFTKALSQLSTYGFVNYGKGTVVATPILFIRGRR